MNCTTARELLLETDLADLHNESELAQHIASCAHCRRMAERLLEGYAQLDRGLNALQPRSMPTRKRLLWLRWTPLPLAAAAVLSLLMLKHEKLPPPPTMLAQLMFAPAPVVTPPAGKQAVVIEKDNATIVWLY